MGRQAKLKTLRQNEKREAKIERRRMEKEAREGPLDLVPIKARVAAAEPGPWIADNYGMYVLRQHEGPVTDGALDEDDEVALGRRGIEEFRKEVLAHLEGAMTGRGAVDDAIEFVRTLEVPLLKPLARMRGAGRAAPQEANNEFIAAARQDVPALVGEVENLRKQLDEARRAADYPNGG